MTKKERKDKHPAGRPSKYKPEHCQLALDLMRKGYSKVAVAAEIGINRSNLFQWIEEIPEFRDAIKQGELLSQAWWEREGLIGLRDGKLNSRLWEINVRNRFREDWSNVGQTQMQLTVSPAEIIEKANAARGKERVKAVRNEDEG